MGKIRIITALVAVSAEIHHFVTLGEKITYESGLVVETCVVAAYAYFHDERFLFYKYSIKDNKFIYLYD